MMMMTYALGFWLQNRSKFSPKIHYLNILVHVDHSKVRQSRLCHCRPEVSLHTRQTGEGALAVDN